LSPAQATEILAILREQEPARRHSPSGFDETIITMSFESPSSDSRMLKYRSLFSEVPGNDIKSFMQQDGRDTRGFRMVRIGTEYFENESGTPITSYQMMQHVSGQEFPIVVGDAESVLRLGPVPPATCETWNSEKANTIAQFLDVVQRICASRWFKSPPSITARASTSGVKELLEANFPTDEETLSVLAYFRQLHAGDRLLQRTVDAYVAHSSDDRKIWWAQERKASFCPAPLKCPHVKL
jgi:hypothetical protein